MKPRKNKEWEAPIVSWLRRHEVPEEKIDPFIGFLFKKKSTWELEAMRSILKLKEEQKPSYYQAPKKENTSSANESTQHTNTASLPAA